MARYTNYDDLLKKWHDLGFDEISKIHKVNAFNHFIKTLPTADVEEVKHGEWKMEYHETRSTRGRLIRNKTFTCSNCNRRNGRITTNYCSNCGAKMDLKGEIHNG